MQYKTCCNYFILDWSNCICCYEQNKKQLKEKKCTIAKNILRKNSTNSWDGTKKRNSMNFNNSSYRIANAFSGINSFSPTWNLIGGILECISLNNNCNFSQSQQATMSFTLWGSCSWSLKDLVTHRNGDKTGSWISILRGISSL